MEAVPRLPMISFELKISPDRPPTDFVKLKQYIRDFYNEDPEAYSTEIHNMETLRATAVRPVRDVTGCSVLKKYFCQLHFLQSRFPMGKDGAAAVPFTWRDAYASMVCTLADIRFEMVAVLYNIGALHSQLGADDNRTSSEGLKLACTHFQCAAWAFQHLKDSFPQPGGVDVSPDVMQFMQQICLAQAQECILEKSMTDNRKATINAKVAAQIVDYYLMALNALVQTGGIDDSCILETVGAKIFKSWKKYVKFKSTYYSCISKLYQGMQSEEQQKMGERVSYFQAAYDKLNEAIKLSKGFDQPDAVSETLMFTMDVVEGKRKAAKNENEFIYHEKVPERDELPDVKGAALVKGIPFSVNDSDISGPDIFARLVPMKAHEASSLYSEEKAKLLRKVGAMLDEKEKELVGFMSSLQLEHLSAHLEPDILPQELIDRCAALSAKPDAIQNLIDAMDKLNSLYHDVDGMLKEILELIKIEEAAEKEYQEVMGSRPPSIVATDLTREANKYKEAHSKAAESNETLHKAMAQHIANLRVLSLPLSELHKQLPTLNELNLEENGGFKNLQHLLGKVEGMRRQRSMLATQLRESICGDDITSLLVTRPSDSLQTIFTQELQKHSRYVSLIEQNLSAQGKILSALTDAYADFSDTRKTITDIIQHRSMILTALMSSYDAYEDLIAKSNKGLEFYRKLETNVTKLLQRVKGTCKVQEEEREQILIKNGKKLPSKQQEETNKESSRPLPIANASTVGSGGLKLRDYLQNMKKDGGSVYPPVTSITNNPTLQGTNPSAVAYNTGGSIQTTPTNVSQTLNYSDTIPTSTDGTQTWVPSAVRPAPVGSEGTTLESAAKIVDFKTNLPVQNYPNYPASTLNYTNPYDLQQYYYRSTQSPSPYSQNYYNANSNVTNPQLTEQHTTAGTLPNSVYNTSTPTNSSVVTTMQSSSLPYQGYSGYGVPGSGYNSVNTATNQFPSMQIQQSGYGTETGYQQRTISQVDTTNNYQNPSMVQNYQQPQVQGYQTANQQVQNYQMMTSQQMQGYQMTNNSAVNPQSTNMTKAITGSCNASQGHNSASASPNHTVNADQSTTAQQFVTGFSNSNNVQESCVATQGNSSNVSYNTGNQTAYPNQCLMNQYGQYINHNVGNYNTYGQTSVPNTYEYSSYQSYQHPEQSQQQVYPQTQQLSPVNQPSAAISSVQQQQTTSAGNPNQGTTSAWNQHDPATSSAYTPVVGNVNNIQYASGAYNNSVPASNTPVTSTSVTAEVSQYQQQYSGYYPPTYPQQYQYSSAAGTSHYTHAAGQGSITSQTDSTQKSVEGHSFATQYSGCTPTQSPDNETSNAAENVNHSYYIQQYGYQLPQYSNNVNNSNASEQVTVQVGQQNNHHQQQQQQQQQQQSSGQMTPVSPMTYMQASNNGVTMTYSQQHATSSDKVEENRKGSTASNVDLLAGLDFSITETPLVPEPSNKDLLKTDSTMNNTDSNKINNVVSSNNSQCQMPKLDNQVDNTNVENKLSNLSLQSPSDNISVQVVADKELQQQLEQNSTTPVMPVIKKEDKMKIPPKDPYSDADLLNQFVTEVEKFEKFVDGLTSKTLNGPTPLDMKWKELQDIQDKDSQKLISVARCYPMKNRFPDILPYDISRVELPSTKDDYINASHVKNIASNCPNFIATQLPMPSTYADFWTMVLEQQVEIVVCLLNDMEIKENVYWPTVKGKEDKMGRIRVNLQSTNIRKHWIERIISVNDGRLSRNIVHLQFTEWPGSSFPASPGPFLTLANETLSLWGQQRSSAGPVIVHCVAGVGRTGLFILSVAAICEIQSGHGLPDLISLTAKVSSCRKNSLHDRELFKFAYQTLLYYAQDMLMKRGILSSRSSFEEMRPKSHTRHPSQDFLLGAPKESGTNNQGSNEQIESNDNSDKSRDEQEKTDDPLRQIDPMWPIKRYQ